MGVWKRELERREDLRGVANAVALEAEAIDECPIHSGTYIDSQDDDARVAAHALGREYVSEGKVDASEDEFLSAINVAIDEAGIDCPSCEKNMQD